jgi:DNA-binding GntR family transcriptional regulator
VSTWSSPRRPIREALAHLQEDGAAHVELDAVALPVVEAQGFDALVLRERIGEAGGRVLAAGKQNEGGGVQGHIRRRRCMPP